MNRITIGDLSLKLDQIQHSVWSIEEEVVKIFGAIARQKADLNEIKSILDLVNGKMDKIDIEITGLRSNNGE